jgi:acyl carrier protein
MGTAVHYANIDAANETDLRSYLETFQQQNWPTIRGVFHSAVVVDDQLLENTDAVSINKVLLPKVLGGWLLHKFLPALDFFVLYSSLGAIWGQPGQGNYAAANTFLDSLAHYRQAQGLPALSVNWGAWKGLGLASSAGAMRTIKELETQGIHGFSPDQGMAALMELLANQRPQAAVIPVNWSIYQQAQTALRQPLKRPFLKEILSQAPQTDTKSPDSSQPQATLREELVAAAATHREEILGDYLQKQVALILKMPPSQIDKSTPLGNLGFDSFMAIKLRNGLENDLALTLSATLVWNYPTLNEMTPYLIKKMGVVADETPSQDASGDFEPDAGAETEANEILSSIEDISDEDALRALLGE